MKQYGFTYNIADGARRCSRRRLQEQNSAGHVENKDGSKIDLQIVVPQGWSDWMPRDHDHLRRAKDAGIRITPR